MIFKKPKNVRYVDMAIWVDENAYKENCDDEKLFEYIYHLIYMLAHKKQYFNNSKYYEDFSIYGASRVLLRIKNPKQFNEINSSGVKLTKIVSVLNYIKSILYPMKVAFEQDNYSQVLSKPSDEDLDNLFSKSIAYSQRSDLIESEFKCYFDDMVKTIYKFLCKIPYITDKKTWINICLSCMLTFLNSITINNKVLDKISSSDLEMYSSDHYIEKIYREENENSLILYHLDPTMGNYIIVLTNRIKKLIADDLSQIIKSYELSDDVVKSLMMSSIADVSKLGDDI